MSATRKTLSPQQSGRLGGYARAAALTREEKARIAARANETIAERYGPGYYSRIALIRHGYRVATPKQAAAKREQDCTR